MFSKLSLRRDWFSLFFSLCQVLHNTNSQVFTFQRKFLQWIEIHTWSNVIHILLLWHLKMAKDIVLCSKTLCGTGLEITSNTYIKTLIDKKYCCFVKLAYNRFLQCYWIIFMSHIPMSCVTNNGWWAVFVIPQELRCMFLTSQHDVY